MIIEEIPYIRIDEINVNKRKHKSDQNESNFIHFLTRPIPNLNIPVTWKSLCYTTSAIKYLMNHKYFDYNNNDDVNKNIKPIRKRFMQTIKPFEWNIIEFNKNRLSVSVLSTGSPCENVMLMFSGKIKESSLCSF